MISAMNDNMLACKSGDKDIDDTRESIVNCDPVAC